MKKNHQLKHSLMTKDKRRFFALLLAFTCATSMFAEKSSNASNHAISNTKSTASIDGVNAVKQQLKKVSGVVTDATGEPVIGANIIVKETATGTITDIDGNYSIEVPQGAILQFTYIGYNSQEVTVGASDRIDVVLSEDTQTLDEVVVIGFGSQKKANLTGAVSSVKMEDLIGDRPITSAADALQGNVPGLLVSSGGNQVGAGKSFQIRGAYSIGTQNADGSYGGNIQPLVLIDNVEGDIDMLNPEDIETISVLKDASSTAIYGARAAGGVILVTTKRPQNNTSFQLNYNNSFSFANAVNLPQQTSLGTYLQSV